MERYLKAQDLLDKFERGLNPLPDVEQDAALLGRLTGADQARLEAYFKLYAIRVDRQELRLFAGGSDQVYVLTCRAAVLLTLATAPHLERYARKRT